MKVQITLDNALVERLDKYADDNYMSRSGLISLATTQFLNASDVTSAVKDMAICIRKIADNGSVDDDTQQKLVDLERYCKLLAGVQ